MPPVNYEKLLNPRGLRHPVAAGILLGGASAYAAGVMITTWLHRKTHGGVEYSEGTKKVMHGLNLTFTGMPFIDWTDHIVHHAYPDQENWEALNEWNDRRPEGAPEAPIEAFRDPYSVKLDGYKKVLFNTPGLHRRAKKTIVPFLLDLHAFDQESGLEDRQHWPAHFRNVDIEEADPEAFRNKYPYAGIVMKAAGITATLGPVVAAAEAATHVGAMFAMAGDINAVNHTGQKKGWINRLKVLAGKEEPVPDEKGEYAANILEGFEAVVLGEKRHKDHHDNPSNPYLAGDTLRRDPGGFIIRRLVKRGWASTPGAPEIDRAA